MATLDDLLWSYQSLIYGLGTNAILGLSMYAVLQLGQLSLGQAAFMGIGAYTGALLTLRLGLPFPLVLAAAAMVPALAALAGLAGALNAHFSSFIGPNEFAFEAAVSILSFAILGGVTTPFGPVLGAFVLTALPELLRPFHDFRLVFNGLIIVLVVIFLPRGILGFRIRRTGG